MFTSLLSVGSTQNSASRAIPASALDEEDDDEDDEYSDSHDDERSGTRYNVCSLRHCSTLC
jgi:hypothetical protein